MNYFKSLFLFSVTLNLFALNHGNANHDALPQEEKAKTIQSVYKKNIDDRIDAHRLSNKGDLPVQVDENPLDIDNKRRRFYTTGDGDCFFWSVGVSREQAMRLWLDNAADPAVRDLAYREIYDEFLDNKLPYAMKQDLRYQQLRKEYEDIKNIVPNGDLSRQIRLKALKKIEGRIRDYAKSGDVYRAYVNQGLRTRSDFMLYPQEWPGGEHFTYFIDALAYLSQKNLTVWTYSEDRQYLIKAHSYYSAVNEGTWETLHQGIHYSRVVPIANYEKIHVAMDAETAAIKRAYGIKDEALLMGDGVFVPNKESQLLSKIMPNNLSIEEKRNSIKPNDVKKKENTEEIKIVKKETPSKLSKISLRNNVVKLEVQQNSKKPLLKKTAITAKKKHTLIKNIKGASAVNKRILSTNRKIISINKKILAANRKIATINKKILAASRKSITVKRKKLIEKTIAKNRKILISNKKTFAANRR